MTWAARFTLRQTAKESLWLVPLLGACAGALIALASVELEGTISVPQSWRFSSSAAEALLTAILGATIGLVGFVVTVTVLMVQTATGAFSARYLRLIYRDGLLKAVLGVLVGTFAYSFVLLRHTDDRHVPDLGLAATGLFVLLGTVLFLAFFSRFLQRLRPVAVASIVAEAGISTFLSSVEATSRRSSVAAGEVPSGPGDVVLASRSGAIQAVHVEGLVAWAAQHGHTVVFRHAVGDFVPPGIPLAEIRGEPAQTDVARDVEGMIAQGNERTIEQDPAFALRIMVDVASRALSPAVNDPTTAVQVLNYVEKMLLVLGRSDFAGRGVYHGSDGVPRVVLPARSWEDYLVLGLSEIRMFGGSQLQVVRRLRSLLLLLRSEVRPEHRDAVDGELARLDATVHDEFGSTVDLDRALVSDRQGLGSPAV